MTVFNQFTPWQFFLWLVFLEVVTLPILAWFVGTVISSYFRMKEAHYGRLLKPLGDAFGKAGDQLVKIAEEAEKTIKQEEAQSEN